MSNFSISTIHHGLFEAVSKSVLSSMLGSMNFRAVAYARMAIRADALESAQRSAESRGYKRISGDELNIDDRNDADAAIAEAAQRAAIPMDLGFNTMMPYSELAEIMMVMRDFFEDRIMSIGIKSQRDQPGTIGETVQYMLSREPQNMGDKAKALAIALDIDPALLVAADLENHEKDVADLRINAGKVITYLERYTELGIDEVAVEKAFDSLPAQVQYKIIAKVIDAYEKQGKQQLLKIMRGSMDAASNYKMLKAKREEAVIWLTTFSKAKHHELEEYLSRGGELPEFNVDIVDSNDTESQVVVGKRDDATHAASARLKEDNDAKEVAREEKRKAKMQRAPAPTA